MCSSDLDEDGRFRLLNVGCPYRSAAEGQHVACAADRRTIELLLGKPVEQVTTIVGGSPCCEYIVEKVDTSERVSSEHASGAN